MDGADPVVASPADGEHRQAPQQPGNIVEQHALTAEEHAGRTMA